MPLRPTRIAFFSLVAICAMPAQGQTVADTSNTLVGTVTEFYDQGQFRIRVIQSCSSSWCPPEGSDVTVRLSSIETPERDQPFGDKALSALQTLLHGSEVYVAPERPPTGDGTVSTITGNAFTDTSWLNRDLVANGLAWVQRQALSEESDFAHWQAEAIAYGNGVWGQDGLPVPPWEWRQGVRSMDLDRLGQTADGWLSRLNEIVLEAWDSHGRPAANEARRSMPIIDQALDEYVR